MAEALPPSPAAEIAEETAESVQCYVFPMENQQSCTGLKCTWKLPSYKLLERHNMKEDLNITIKDTLIFSAAFYPSGYNVKDDRCICLGLQYLIEKSDPEEVFGVFGVKIIDSTDTVVYSSPPGSMFNFKEDTNYSCFFNSDFKYDGLDDYSLSIVIEGAFWWDTVSDIPDVIQILESKIREIIKQENHFDTEGDFYLEANDNEKVKITRERLVSKSNYFRERFDYERPKNAIPERHDFENMQRDIFRELTQFMRTDTVTQNFSNIVFPLSDAASKVGFKDLLNLCMDRIFHTITIENAADYYVMVHDNNCEQLRRRVVKYILDNGPSVVKTESYKSLESSELLGPFIRTLFILKLFM